jgi:DNA-binding transcriptional LysR family regulator
MPDGSAIFAVSDAIEPPQASSLPFPGASAGVHTVHIHYFLAVCEVRNFTLAAKQCGVSQPTLSVAIGRLEQKLGGQLFRRERNPRVAVQITPLASRVRPYFDAIARNLDAAMNAAKNEVP